MGDIIYMLKAIYRLVASEKIKWKICTRGMMMRELIKFGVVGVGNTVLTIIFFNIFVFFQINFLIANIIAYFIGMLNSYHWNKTWVFKANQAQREAFYKFIIVNLFVLGINNLVLYFGVNMLHFSPFISQMMGTVVGMAVNFLLNRSWTFKKAH